MNQKQILTALAVVVVVVIALVLFNKSNKVNDSTEQTNKTDTVENVDTNSTEPATNTNSTSSEMATNPPVAEPTAPDGNDVAVSEINKTTVRSNQVKVRPSQVLKLTNLSHNCYQTHHK